MFELPWSLKQNIEDLKGRAEKAAKNVGRGIQQTLDRAKIEAQIKYPEITSKIETSCGNIVETFNDIIIEDKLNLFKAHSKMKHKVIMLGGRRAGKSTILASILELLKDTPGSLCTISDATDYPLTYTGSDGQTHSIPSLADKRREVAGYIREKSPQSMFLVDMTPNAANASYTLRVSSGDNTVDLEFVDVPGEWMRQSTLEHEQLKEVVRNSDVFIVAIDTPFLMQDGMGEYDEQVNSVYNRVDEITTLLQNEIKIEVDGIDKKLILFCPVKCEKWARSGRITEVTDKVKVVYKDIANKWLKSKYANDVEIRIMPISTVGGLVSYKLLPAKRYFKDDDDRVGISCSEDTIAKVLIAGDGRTIRQRKNSYLEDDALWMIDHTKIPLSWYQVTGDGFNPQFCEQPGYHILRFLINKEENVIRMTAEDQKQRLSDMNPIFRWLTKTFVPTFGVYLPVWNEVINGLANAGLIKEEGDGFMRIIEIVD